MGWYNATPTSGGGYRITPGGGNGSGGSMGLVYLICAFGFYLGCSVNWAATWFLWVPVTAFIIWRVVRFFMDL